MQGSGEERKTEPASISGLVPMISVEDVERSAAFYELLGFAVGNRVPRNGAMGWAWLYAPGVADWKRGPNLMLLRSAGHTDLAKGALVLYLYAADLVGLREKLIEAGQKPGPIQYPEYLPKGEFAVHDPDGYRVMLAQSMEDTP